MKRSTIFAIGILLVAQLGWSKDQDLQKVSQLLDAGKSGDAKALLEPILKQQPQNAEAHELMGDAFREGGNGKEAEREYRLALELGVHDAGLLSSLATVQKWNRHFSAARSSYEHEREADPYSRAAKDELQSLELKRGLTLFGAFGGWETDSTTKGWEADASYLGFDKLDTYAGASYADKFFYTRRSFYGKAYSFFSPTGYVKVSFEENNYNYPQATNPVPDANAYQHVPTAGIEVSGDLRRNLRGTVGYEFFRPTFFFATGEHANNHKLSADLSYQTAWRPLQFKLKSAILRDPDPNHTVVDKVNHNVSIAYGTQFLVGGGMDFSSRRFEGELLVLPNRDLDRSTNYSFLTGLTVPVARDLKLKSGYIYDHYSSQSVFTGKIAQVYHLGFSWQSSRWLEVSLGGKVVRRPIRNDQAVYVTTSFRLPLR